MKRLLLILMILCIATSVTAIGDSDIEISVIRDNILQDESAQFLIEITNNDSSLRNVRMYSPDVEWNIPTITLEIGAKAEVTEKLVIKPTKYIAPGMYGVNLNFRVLETEELIKKIVFVNVKPPGQAVSNYVTSINIDANIEKELEPGKNAVLTVVVENQNVLLFENLTLRIRSEIDVFNSEEEVELKSLEKKALEMTYAVDALQTPGDYKISYELLKGTQTIARGAPIDVTVIENNPDYKESVEVDKGFLRITNVITYTSESNNYTVKTIKIESGLLKRLFTDTSVESKIIEEDGKKYIAFDLALVPGEGKRVWVVTNYKILFYAIIIILAGIILYFKYKSPIKIIKSVANVQMKEGGISNLKVMLAIRNTGGNVKKVTIVDYIPNIADISKEFIEGTLKPSKVLVHQKKGTILKWELSEISPGEERLISYDLQSKLSIIGNFRLPRAKVVFKKGKREVYSYSNSLGVNA